MHFDRRILVFAAGIAGFVAMMLGLRRLLARPDDGPADDLVLPLSMIAGAVLMMGLAWRGWRQAEQEEDSEREAIATADGRFHAFANTGAQVIFLVLLTVILTMVAATPSVRVDIRVISAIGVVTLAACIWYARRTAAGPVLSIGEEGIESQWYGLIPWDAVFGIAIHREVRRTSRGGEYTITWLALGVDDPDRFLSHASTTDRVMRYGNSSAAGSRFGNLLLPVMNLNQDAARIAAVATSHKRRTGLPMLPAWRPDLDGDEVTALVERHRRTGTFPG